MSNRLGLHKESFNYLSANMKVKRNQGLQIMKNLYKSIEPVEEEAYSNKGGSYAKSRPAKSASQKSRARKVKNIIMRTQERRNTAQNYGNSRENSIEDYKMQGPPDKENNYGSTGVTGSAASMGRV